MNSHDTEANTPRRGVARSPILLLLDAYAPSDHARARATALSAMMQAPLLTSGTTMSPGPAPRLVVMGDRPDAVTTALALVEQLAVPVLIARALRWGGSIVASSDLRRAEHPVLREAIVLSRLLGRRVTFVHNAGELAEGSGVHPLPTHESYTYLRLIAMHSGCDATAVVTSARNTADSIVEVAALDDADLVLVGHCSHDDPHHHLASVIVRRCTASVLVLPVPPRYG